MKFNDEILISLVWLFIEFIPIIRYVRLDSITNFIINIIKNIPIKIFYPSIVEEVIFRGLFFSGLLAFGLSEDKSNIIQAIVFGLIHLYYAFLYLYFFIILSGTILLLGYDTYFYYVQFYYP